MAETPSNPKKTSTAISLGGIASSIFAGGSAEAIIAGGIVVLTGLAAVAIGIAVVFGRSGMGNNPGSRGVDIIASTPTKSIQEFIDKIKDAVIAAGKDYPVPNSVSIAQAILESGFGNSLGTKRTNNLFGMMNTNHKLLSYNNWNESIIAHARYLGTALFDNYETARKNFANDPKNFIITIAPTYAPAYENKNYPGKIIGLMETYHLYQYDKK